MIGGRNNGTELAPLEARRKPGGRIEVTAAGETLEAAAAFWRAILFDMRAREALRLVVSRDLVAKPIESPVWWNGDGRP